MLIQIFAAIQSHLHFEYSASQASVVLIVFSAKQVPHPEMFNEVRNSFGGELKKASVLAIFAVELENYAIIFTNIFTRFLSHLTFKARSD